MEIRPCRFLWLLAFVLVLFPLGLFAQWVPLGPDGGDARSLAYDPHNPDRIYLGTSAGQLYASNDHGRTWSRFARLGSGDDYVLDNMEVDPSDSKTMYVAAWSVDGQISGGDIFRTRDGGKTWQALPGMHGKSIRAMAVAASDNRIILAGALDGVFRSNDGGDSWQRISPPNHAEIKNIESVAIDPRDPAVIYAGTWHLAWKTTDGGKNWHAIKNGVIDDSDVFSIIVDHKDSSVVYLSACSGIYKSEAAGELFRKVQGMPFSARRTRVLQQDPNDMNVVYAGTTEGLWKTVDTGKTWKRVTGANIIVNDVMVDPRSSSRVMIATDRSGVLASNDGAQTFVATNRGFAHRQVSAVVVDRNDPNTLYAGVVNDKEFGGVFTSNNDGTDWRQITDGLSGKDVFAIAQADNGALVVGTNRGMYMLPRGEREWRAINTIVTEKEVRVAAKTKSRKVKPTYRTEFVKSEFSGRVTQLDVEKTEWFAATSSGLYSSRDDGRTWRGGEVKGYRNFVAVRSLNGTVVATTLNSVLISKDHGATWTACVLPKYVTAIYGGTVAPNAVWIATREGALKSSDGGATWEHVLSGLPARHVFAVAYDHDSNRLLATTLDGDLYESRDAGNSWHGINTGWTVRNVAAGRGRLLAITAFDGLLMKRESEASAAMGGNGSGSDR